MTRRPKPPSTEETLKLILKHRIAYGADEPARYVEHVCRILIDSRFGPGASDDMFTLEDHEAEDAPPLLVDLVEFGVPPSGGSLRQHQPAKAAPLNFWDASLKHRSDRPDSGFTPAACRGLVNLRGQAHLRDCQPVRGP